MTLKKKKSQGQASLKGSIEKLGHIFFLPKKIFCRQAIFSPAANFINVLASGEDYYTLYSTPPSQQHGAPGKKINRCPGLNMLILLTTCCAL
jgi:hypothetical protein